MIAGISSALSELFGALLAVANPRLLNATQSTQDANKSSKTSAVDSTASLGGKSELSDEERQQVDELKQRDAEVRRHEAAHKAAAGAHARGGPSFEYQTGPDGKRYAVGGEVSIDTSEVPGDPQATLRKMQQIRRAANAPAEPSAKDRQIAAQAAQIESQAQAELAQQKREGVEGTATQAGAATTDAINVAPSTPPNDSAAPSPAHEASARSVISAPQPDRSNAQAVPNAPNQSSTGAAQAITNQGRNVVAASTFGTKALQPPGRFIDVRA